MNITNLPYNVLLKISSNLIDRDLKISRCNIKKNATLGNKKITSSR